MAQAERGYLESVLKVPPPLLPSPQIRARCHHLPVKEETLQRVGLYIETIIGSLPEDLQTVLHHH